MSHTPQHVRVFLASPGDVADERAMALRILDDLAYDPSFRGRVTLEAVAWDQPKAGTALLAHVTPQEAISAGLPKPSECDIVVVIFWSRMGTPLPSQYRKPDGSAYSSGTEYEFEDALAACRERGRPFILLYRRMEKPAAILDDPSIAERLDQYQAVRTFFLQFTEKDTGASLAGINQYQSPTDFAESLETHLRELVERLLRDASMSSIVLGADIHDFPAWTESPFPGLRALSPKDAHIFFGRGHETDTLVKRILATSVSFLAVVGASGSGKSSLVGAGLIPRLQAIPDNIRWSAVTVTPDYLGSGNPFAALGAAILRDLPNVDGRGLVIKLQNEPRYLATVLSQLFPNNDSSSRLLLFVDQFEELFTTVEPRLRDGFIDALTQLAQYRQITTIITLRADFYGQCVEIPGLAKLLEDGTYPLSTPRVVALLEMILRPASRAGVRFEDGLVERILDDTGDEPGALPLMAYTLDELYRVAGKSKVLTHLAYEALGRVQGAIGKRSEEVFSTLLDDERVELPHVFRELVEVDERGIATRQRAMFQHCAQTDAAKRLIHALADARLLVLSEDEQHVPYVEVAHEALLRSWQRLAQWISETEDDLRLLRQVRLAAREWEENGRRDDYLWSQERLEPVYEMQYRLQVVFDPEVRDFVRPETDRLLDDFKADSRYFRQRPIIERLAKIGPRSIPALVSCLTDAYTQSSLSDIGSALGNFGAPSIVALLGKLKSGNPVLKRRVCEVLGGIRKSSVVPLLGDIVSSLAEMLNDSDVEVCISAANALGKIDSSNALPCLSRALEHSENRVRISAIQAIDRLSSPDIVPVLMSALENSSDNVRSRAAASVGILGDASPISTYNYGKLAPRPKGKFYDVIKGLHGSQTLIRVLHDQEANVRISAATALGKLGDSSAIGALAECTTDRNPEVASSAAYALAVIGESTGVPYLVDALRSPHAAVRATCARLLGILGATSTSVGEYSHGYGGYGLNRYGDIRSLGNRLGTLHTEVVRLGAIAALIKALADKDADVCECAAASLGMLGDKIAVPSLTAALQDKNSNLRQLASQALGYLADRRATSALIEALEDSNGSVRLSAIRALQAIGDASAVPALVILLERYTAKRGYADDEVINSSLLAIEELARERAVPVAERFKSHPDAAVRQTALLVLLRHARSKRSKRT